MFIDRNLQKIHNAAIEEAAQNDYVWVCSIGLRTGTLTNFAVVVLQSVTQREGRNDKTDHSWVVRLHAPHNVSMPRTTARAVLHTHGTNTAVCKRMPAYHKAHLQEWSLTTPYRNLFDSNFFFLTRVIINATQSHGVRNSTLHCHEGHREGGIDWVTTATLQYCLNILKKNSPEPNFKPWIFYHTLKNYGVEAHPRSVATFMLWSNSRYMNAKHEFGALQPQVFAEVVTTCDWSYGIYQGLAKASTPLKPPQLEPGKKCGKLTEAKTSPMQKYRTVWSSLHTVVGT